MDSEKKIEELLARYWACETSLEEERQLMEYFNSGQVPDKLKETGALFQYFNEQKKKSLDDSVFDGSALVKASKPAKGRSLKLLQNTLRIAAGIAVVMVAVWFVRSEIRKSQPQEIVDTYSNPKEAFEETKKALLMISKSFGTAEEQAKKIDLFNEAQKKIQEGQGAEAEKKNHLKDS